MGPVERYGLRRVLHANMNLAAEASKVEDTDEGSLLSHVRAADTPPNSPRLRATDLGDGNNKRPALYRGRRYGLFIL